ncbi:MAG: hypothetical protein HY866_08845 [Chloroflexi bacterium]|nr:hypothetical protein [Chloroflexota bacterium]
MDITRHWRLKTTRTHLLATHCPSTGAVILPQNGTVSPTTERYEFETEAEQTSVQAEDASYARAAR